MWALGFLFSAVFTKMANPSQNDFLVDILQKTIHKTVKAH